MRPCKFRAEGEKNTHGPREVKRCRRQARTKVILAVQLDSLLAFLDKQFPNAGRYVSTPPTERRSVAAGAVCVRSNVGLLGNREGSTSYSWRSSGAAASSDLRPMLWN